LGRPGGETIPRASRLVARGFTLLELLVVVSIMALATAGVGFALADGGRTRLQREGDRLAALLDSARAQSRATGSVVSWRASTTGFHFDGVAPGSLPEHWLEPGTQPRTPKTLWLGPETLIGAQDITLVNSELPGQAVRVASDGLRPFTAQALQ